MKRNSEAIITALLNYIPIMMKARLSGELMSLMAFQKDITGSEKNYGIWLWDTQGCLTGGMSWGTGEGRTCIKSTLTCSVRIRKGRSVISAFWKIMGGRNHPWGFPLCMMEEGRVSCISAILIKRFIR